MYDPEKPISLDNQPPQMTAPESIELALQDNQAKIRRWGYLAITPLPKKLQPADRDTFLDDVVEVEFRPEPPEDICA